MRRKGEMKREGTVQKERGKRDREIEKEGIGTENREEKRNRDREEQD